MLIIQPFCRRCTSTGRTCDGYAPLPTSTISSSSSSKPTPPAIQDMPPYEKIPLYDVEDPMEQKMLQFFRTTTAHKLSANFSGDFWERRVLASSGEPSIRHGIIAIAAIHQDYLSRHENNGVDQDPVVKSFAFRQYTMAISYLHRLMSSETTQLDVTLTSCILFICFDCISGNHDSAIIHLRAGLQILEDIRKKNNRKEDLLQRPLQHEWEQEFAPLLLALGVQAASFYNPKYSKDRSALWHMSMAYSFLKLELPHVDEGRNSFLGGFREDARYVLATVHSFSPLKTILSP